MNEHQVGNAIDEICKRVGKLEDRFNIIAPLDLLECDVCGGTVNVIQTLDDCDEVVNLCKICRGEEEKSSEMFIEPHTLNKLREKYNVEMSQLRRQLSEQIKTGKYSTMNCTGCESYVKERDMYKAEVEELKQLNANQAKLITEFQKVQGGPLPGWGDDDPQSEHIVELEQELHEKNEKIIELKNQIKTGEYNVMHCMSCERYLKELSVYRKQIGCSEVALGQYQADAKAKLDKAYDQFEQELRKFKQLADANGAATRVRQLENDLHEKETTIKAQAKHIKELKSKKPEGTEGICACPKGQEEGCFFAPMQPEVGMACHLTHCRFWKGESGE